MQSARKVRRFAGPFGEHVDRFPAAEPLRPDSVAAGQLQQKRGGGGAARSVVGQQRGELHSEYERERAVVAGKHLFDAIQVYETPYGAKQQPPCGRSRS